MALSKALLTLSLLATVSGLSESVNGRNGSPVITSTTLSEVIVNPGEDYTITCEGDSPLTWNYTDRPDNEPRIQVTQKNGKYVSSIQLINVTYMDVGYYHCVIDNNNEKNSSIYVYVNDTENLLTHDLFFESIHVLQYENIIIPCKPTHPEVNVTLCTHHEEKLNIGDNDYFGVLSYNQKVGFILENAQVIHNGFYICCVLPDGICSIECLRIYSVEVLKYEDSVAKPAIDNTDLQHVNVGDNVTMECTVTVPLSTKYELEWIIPNRSDRIIVEDTEVERPTIQRLSTGRKKLKIVNAELEDMGDYICKVTDHAKNTNHETLYLKIFERNEAYTNLTVNENVAEVVEGQDFKWAINVEAHPKPNFTWSKNGTEINNSSRIFFTSSPDMKQSILEIKRVTIQDSGVYEMEATNRNFSKELKLKLIVLGKPHVYMPSSPLKLFHGSSQQVNCTILGRPSPNVTWFFQPDGSEKKKFSTEHFKNYVVSEEEGYKTVSELELKATVSGSLECLAANKYGIDIEETQIIIVDVADGFGILPVQKEIVEGDTVNLTCRASKHNFTKNMKWYRNGKEIYENRTKRIWIQKGETTYSYQTELIITNASVYDGFEYKCVACTSNPNVCSDRFSFFKVAPAASAGGAVASSCGPATACGLGLTVAAVAASALSQRHTLLLLPTMATVITAGLDVYGMLMVPSFYIKLCIELYRALHTEL